MKQYNIKGKNVSDLQEQRNQAAERNRGERAKASGLAPTSIQSPYYSRSEGRALEPHHLPKSCKKRRKAPGTASRFASTCDSLTVNAHVYRTQVEPDPTPNRKADEVKTWIPRGLIPKGF